MAGGRKESTGFYEAVRDLGGDVWVKPCDICNRRLRAKFPMGDGGFVTACGACDHAFDWPRVKAAGAK